MIYEDELNDEKDTPAIVQAKDPALKRSDRHKEIVAASGPTLIMDMAWGGFMDEHSQKKVIQQIQISYSFNKKADISLPIIFTSVDLTWHQLFHRVNAFQWNKKIIKFEKQDLTNIGVPKEKLVYLTADTDNVCTSLDPTKYYIIGCLLDHNSKKGVTRDFADDAGIRKERLPIDEYITMEGRHVLTINHVAEILIRVANGINWGDAFIQTIPARKHPVKIEDSKKNVKSNETNEESGFWSLCNIQ